MRANSAAHDLTGTLMISHSTLAGPTLGMGSAFYMTSGMPGLRNTLIAGYTFGISRTRRRRFPHSLAIAIASSGHVIGPAAAAAWARFHASLAPHERFRVSNVS